MIIGILTYHKADNYGAVLQAYALTQYIRKLGYNVEIIDYWPPYHAKLYKLWCWNGYFFRLLGKKGKILYVIKYPFLLLKNFLRKLHFVSFRFNHMNIKPIRSSYDAVFYGSDIIWNRWNFNTLPDGFDKTYWGGNNIKTPLRFSYAASIGNAQKSKEIELYCRKSLPQFKKLSVRETHLKELLEIWGFHDVIRTIDPTFLLTSEDWNRVIGNKTIEGEYILCYNLENSIVINELANIVKREKDIKVIYLTGTISQIQKEYIFDTAGPQDFLTLFKYATYVVTSSFHGVVFSLIYNKQFCFHSKVQTERIISILHICELDERFIDSPIPSMLYKPINYQNVNTILKDEIQDSKNFIIKCLKMTIA